MILVSILASFVGIRAKAADLRGSRAIIRWGFQGAPGMMNGPSLHSRVPIPHTSETHRGQHVVNSSASLPSGSLLGAVLQTIMFNPNIGF